MMSTELPEQENDEKMKRKESLEAGNLWRSCRDCCAQALYILWGSPATVFVFSSTWKYFSIFTSFHGFSVCTPTVLSRSSVSKSRYEGTKISIRSKRVVHPKTPIILPRLNCPGNQSRWKNDGEKRKCLLLSRIQWKSFSPWN